MDRKRSLHWATRLCMKTCHWSLSHPNWGNTCTLVRLQSAHEPKYFTVVGETGNNRLYPLFFLITGLQLEKDVNCSQWGQQLLWTVNNSYLSASFTWKLAKDVYLAPGTLQGLSWSAHQRGTPTARGVHVPPEHCRGKATTKLGLV